MLGWVLKRLPSAWPGVSFREEALLPLWSLRLWSLHPYIINHSLYLLQIYVWDAPWISFKQNKKIFTNQGSQVLSIFFTHWKSLYWDSRGLSWEIPPILSLLKRDLWAWLSALKACQTAQTSTKTCSMKPGWSNLHAASILPLVTIFPQTYPLQVTLKATSSTAEHSNTIYKSCFSPKTFQDPLPSKPHRLLLLRPH